MKPPCSLTCSKEFLLHLQNTIRRFDARPHDNPDLKHAAVAITVVDDDRRKEAAVILTLRSSRLRHHACQWALPGGRIDNGETPEETALRELSEEVGLNLDPDSIIGRLDDYVTRSGYAITPVAVWGGKNRSLNPNPGEVRSVHRVRLTELLRPDTPAFEKIPESEHPVLYMPIGSGWIAAPTAAMVYQFREVGILGRSTRVSHFEQPYFAWR